MDQAPSNECPPQSNASAMPMSASLFLEGMRWIMRLDEFQSLSEGSALAIPLPPDVLFSCLLTNFRAEPLARVYVKCTEEGVPSSASVENRMD